MPLERIIEAVRRNRALFPLGLFCWASAVSTLQARPFLTPDQVRRTTFTGSCLQKQWTMTPDGNFELVMAAGDDDCTGSIYFYSPLAFNKPSFLRFGFRSYKGNVGFSVATAEHEKARPLDRTDNLIAVSSWQTERFSYTSKNREFPSYISRIDVTVYPRRVSTPTLRSLVIRDFRLDALPAAQAVAAPPAPIVTTAPATETKAPAVSLQTPLVPAASPSTTPASGFLPSFALAGFIVFAGGLLYRRYRKTAPTEFSPLYEVNTRTWGSERDADGVVRLGGFKAITRDQLKSLRASGFHSIWVMGIWEIGSKVRAISKNYASDFQGSPFAINDYAIAEELGGDAAFKNFVDRAHGAGLRVIIDFVPNHMGFDSLWIAQHPEFFIHKTVQPDEENLADDVLRAHYPHYFPYRVPHYSQDGQNSGPRTLMVAYGRDPYFYPWIDTAQLDYAQPALRQRMIQILRRWATVVDGVRCDMAMLVLREQVKNHRHPEMSQEQFDQQMPQEFWIEAIAQVKRVNPRFLFIAETYWAMEGYLQQLGFDYTYNKPVYEAMGHAFHTGHAESLTNFLRMLGESFLKKSVHFIENHDEERAMNAFGEERQRAAAVVMATLPGLSLFHQGQMEGVRERLPVQRVVLMETEKPNKPLFYFYRQLLRASSEKVFRSGDFRILYANNPSLISYARTDRDSQIIVVVNSSDHLQKGLVHISPVLPLENGRPFVLTDLFFSNKSKEARRRGAKPSYVIPAAALINQGLYVELDAFDSHIFRLERSNAPSPVAHVKRWLKALNAERPLPRTARRMLGASFTRRSD